jgi:hypothetical protein
MIRCHIDTMSTVKKTDKEDRPSFPTVNMKLSCSLSVEVISLIAVQKVVAFGSCQHVQMRL